MVNNINTGLFNQSLKEITDCPEFLFGQNIISAFFYISNMTDQNIYFYDSNDNTFEWFQAHNVQQADDKGVVAKKPPIPLLPPNRTSSFVVAENNGSVGTKFSIKFLFNGFKYELKLDLNGYVELIKNNESLSDKPDGCSVFVENLDDSNNHLRLIWGFDMAIIEIAQQNDFSDTGVEL